MGGGNYNMNSSQFEFLKDESYDRRRGCFVTTPKAIIYVVIALVSMIIVVLAMYYYGPYSSVVKTVENPMDIEKLLNYSVGNISHDIRLPKYIEPTLYKLKLDPILGKHNSTLRGEVSIELKCSQRTKTITLNAEKLDITSVRVFRIDEKKNRVRRNPVLEESGVSETNVSEQTTISTLSSTSEGNIVEINNNSTTAIPTSTTEFIITETTNLISSTEETTVINEKNRNDNIKLEEITTTELNITDHKYDLPNSKYVVKLKKDLEAQKQYLITIEFSSNISDSFQGIYNSTYKDETAILATQLQPIYARQLFPCFDEPSFKSAMQLSIRNRENATILSNTPLSRTYKDDDQKIWAEFEKTPSIPTYLFGFIIGDLVKVQEEKSLVRVWGLRNSKIEANDAILYTKKILDGLQKYFGSSFPSREVDIVAVRQLRFTVASAGLIFIKETLFLPSSKSELERKNELFGELTKALTKEWIGNLVSINWWDDFWMINGFSIFMLEELRSEQGKWGSDFTLEVTQETLQSDDLKSTSSLGSKIENTIQIFDISDKIKYNKGSCLLRMLNASLAPLTFKKGVQYYIKEWQGNSTNVENLWKSFDLVVTEVDNLPRGKKVEEIMETWTTQPTYPLVTVVRNTSNNTLIINQTKFNSNENFTDTSLWIIPITYMVGNNEDEVETKRFWLTEKSSEINDVAKDLKNKWILFNVDQTGYYRVNYDSENWKLLTNTLYMNYTKIPVNNRGQLINDAFDLAEHGLLDYPTPFNLSKYLINETRYIPWASALKSLEFIRSILETTYLNGAYEDYMANLIGNIYDQISSETDLDGNRAKLKDLIVETACEVNYLNCTKWALGKLDEWIKNPNINITNRKTALCTGIRLSGRKEWEIMFERLRLDEIKSESEDLLSALGCTKHSWLINRYLDSTLNGKIPFQYVSRVWQSIHQISSRTFGFKYLRENWKRIFSVYREKRLILKTIIRDFLYTLSTKSDKEDLTLFFGKHEDSLQEFSYLLKGVVDRIDTRISWTEKHLKTMDTYLSFRK